MHRDPKPGSQASQDYSKTPDSTPLTRQQRPGDNQGPLPPLGDDGVPLSSTAVKALKDRQKRPPKPPSVKERAEEKQRLIDEKLQKERRKKLTSRRRRAS